MEKSVVKSIFRLFRLTPQLIVIALWAAFCLTLPLPGAVRKPVATSSGPVMGAPGSDPTILVYKGIPYAAPPVGDLRWRPPQPPIPWTAVRMADQFSAGCIQKVVTERKPWTEEFMHHGPISEDCLCLNIWTEAKPAMEKRPVYVYIHGGGYVEGSGSVAVYDGEGLAKKGLVVVTINYRLGVFGFLAHPELTRESPNNASGNYGLMDQVAALQWIQQNIAAFGGDPGCVTIAGQSAGAGSIHALTASPLAKGLFHRAIAESGSGSNRPPRKLADAEQDGIKFAQTHGGQSLQQLRSMKAEELAATAEGQTFTFIPVVDGWFIPQEISDLFAQGKQNDVPMLTGLNADEGSSSPTYGKIPSDQWIKQVQQRYGDMADVFLRLYPAETQDQAGLAQKESARDQGRVSMSLWAKNRAKTAKAKVFTYYWDHAEPGPDKELYAAFHTSEVPYVMNSLKKSPRPWDATDYKVADMMSSYWANFAKTGNPNSKGLPAWAPFDPKKPVTMKVGDKPGLIPVADKAKLEFYERFLTQKSPPQQR